MANQYERALMRWNLERAIYIRDTGQTTGLQPMALARDRKELFGIFPSTDALSTRVTARLLADASLHTLEMASLPTPKGGSVEQWISSGPVAGWRAPGHAGSFAPFPSHHV